MSFEPTVNATIEPMFKKEEFTDLEKGPDPEPEADTQQEPTTDSQCPMLCMSVDDLTRVSLVTMGAAFGAGCVVGALIVYAFSKPKVIELCEYGDI